MLHNDVCGDVASVSGEGSSEEVAECAVDHSGTLDVGVWVLTSRSGW